jgi:sugar/nucleoside kinase (ribokinase family)
MTKKTAILSHIVIDEIHEMDSTAPVLSVGGAGAYAAVGASLVTAPDDSYLVSGVGSLDRGYLAAWCTDRGINSSALFTVGDHSPRTRIEYLGDGERQEAPVYGLAHFDAHTPLPRNLPTTPQFDGFYLFHAHEDSYWAQVEPFRNRHAAKPLLWELSADSAHAELIELVQARARLVDALSLNLTEARLLTGESRPTKILDLLHGWCPIIILRMGSAGSLLMHPSGTDQVGIAVGQVTDPTGGGNSYSGAFLAGMVSGLGPTDAARLAASAASVVIQQHGAPEINDELRATVRHRAEQVTVAPYIDKEGAF